MGSARRAEKAAQTVTLAQSFARKVKTGRSPLKRRSLILPILLFTGMKVSALIESFLALAKARQQVGRVSEFLQLCRVKRRWRSSAWAALEALTSEAGSFNKLL